MHQAGLIPLLNTLENLILTSSFWIDAFLNHFDDFCHKGCNHEVDDCSKNQWEESLISSASYKVADLCQIQYGNVSYD